MASVETLAIFDRWLCGLSRSRPALVDGLFDSRIGSLSSCSRLCLETDDVPEASGFGNGDMVMEPFIAHTTSLRMLPHDPTSWGKWP